MVTVKFAVLLFLIASCVSYSKYCKICSNHILCEYPIAGPSQSCKKYDRNTFLTDDDIYDLVNQINERRNFIAVGNSKHLPGAANMNKLVWSEELAKFAQRWVDQCDPSLRPDKEDQCRDLEYSQVGQNIGSITNPSPEFNVKSFIEMWFMQSLDYKGAVSYYDQSKDHRSNYFSQLIWAETKNVGCGRAKFSVSNVIVERIVCNFSPRGNVNRNPVYAIGFPATQCRNEMVPDEKFEGLCTRKSALKTKLTSAKLPESNLLRILYLSNDSVKQEIDPIYNNMKQIIRHRNEMDSPKHQMMRHVFRNNVQSKVRDNQQRQVQHFWDSPVNASRSYKDPFYDSKKGHKLGHTHLYSSIDQPAKHTEREDFSKYPFTDSIDNYDKQCTRKTDSQDEHCEHSSNIPSEKFYECTRRRKTNSQVLQDTKTPVLNNIQHVVPYESCPCRAISTTYPTTNKQYRYTFNCNCENVDSQTVRCPNLLRTLKENGNIPNAALARDKISYNEEYPNLEDENESLLNNGPKNKPYKLRSSYIQSNRERKKRELTTLKPFWKMDSYTYDGKPELKALRYTTLHNNRRPNTKKRPFKSTTTESITIELKNSKVPLATEKYLSFDELLHLRKLNITGNNARRQFKPEILRRTDEETPSILREATTQSTDATIASTEYTTNTPFIRIKHCTRKLTCTWTAATLSNGAHSRQPGSRTPPGYVEGCTRTSTCTRDYMDRNKLPIITQSSTATDDDDDDSDYCERRSLNVQKRKSQKKKRSFLDQINCFRKKRKSIIQNKSPSNNLSYGDLYYLVLRKIRENWNHHRKRKCSCNKAVRARYMLHAYLFSPITYLFYV